MNKKERPLMQLKCMKELICEDCNSKQFNCDKCKVQEWYLELMMFIKDNCKENENVKKC